MPSTTRRALSSLLLVTGLPAACSRAPQVEPATLVLRGGTIITVDDAKPEAQALAVRGDRIVAVGSAEDIAAYVGPATKVIDLAGATAIPGLIESHGHFTGLGQSKMTLDLMDDTSWEAIVAKVRDAARAARPGDWILGRGWHQEKWSTPPSPAVEGFPVHDALSAAAPDNPVLLTHASGHAAFVNARAMALAGITARTPNPQGGEILKDAKGQPTGLLRETAAGLAQAALGTWRAAKSPAERDADARRQIALADAESLRYGITTFHDAGSTFETIDLYKQVVSEGSLGVRLWVMVRDTNERLRARLASTKVVGMGDHHLTVAAIKKSIDGALGSRGAWLLAAYSDLPGSTGLNTTPVPDIVETAAIAIEQDVQLAVHAIGDRANRETLDLFEAAFATHPGGRDRRWRIEHAQHLSPADVPRFKTLGVIAAMQGVHCTSDAPYVLERLGPARADEGAYVWRTLIDAGAVISNGTDTPVERIDPIVSYTSTVTRRLKDGSVFYGNQRMTRLEALKSYTLNGAFAGKEEALKGSLTVGKLADITVLSQNLLTVPDEQLPATTVQHTIVGGVVRYSAGQ